MGDLTGFHYLALLLAQPHHPIEALELVCTHRGARKGEAEGAFIEASSGAGPPVDERALRDYLHRIHELRADLAEAEADHDLARKERMGVEIEFLRRELSRGFDLAGRPRPTGASHERARVSVTRALRKAIARMDHVHPALAAHLRSAIQTGRQCRYAPVRAESIDWAT